MWSRWGAHAAVLLVLAGTLTALAAPAARPRTLILKPTAELRLRGLFDDLAADGFVAIAKPDSGGGDINFVPVWNARTHKTFTKCGCTFGEEMQEVAIAGDRVAWVTATYGESHGPLLSTQLVTATIARRPKQIADAFDEDGVGSYLGGLVGGGSLLLVSHTREDTLNTEAFTKTLLKLVPGGGGACPRTSAGGSQRVPECVPLQAAAQALAVDGARILADDGLGKLVLLRPDGTVLAETRIPRGPATLTGPTILVLRGRALAVYDTAGRAVRSIRVPAAGYGLDAAAGFALYTAARAWYLVRLSDGAVARLLAPERQGVVEARIESTGLFYLYASRSGPQRLAFTSLERLRAQFGV